MNVRAKDDLNKRLKRKNRLSVKESEKIKMIILQSEFLRFHKNMELIFSFLFNLFSSISNYG